ncbi:MAG: radical SAM protein [Candidatus Margulisbacteria bacterium]|jgi:MoaA/NifB/PqqE/SkfB family radical SAM enzyme|nr:radical SAM protein [Candidatus Margulisiibacteriota bacterium]
MRKLIEKEIKHYPLDYFTNSFRIAYLSLEITNKCTNACRHCTNYCSPRQKKFLPITLVKKLIDQAVQQKHDFINIWGGEPFLHPDLYLILKYCLDNGLTPCVNTNAFWAYSLEAAEKTISQLKRLGKGGKTVRLALSCDRFHQEQKATPLINIVNALAVLEREKLEGYRIHSVESRGDNTLAKVFGDLRKHNPNISLEKVRQRTTILPLEKAAGRAKILTEQGADPYARFTLVNSEIIFCVSVTGEVFFYETFIGNEIMPLGNVYKQNITEILKNMNRQKLLKLLHFQPLKFFFYPFRKYVDIQKITQELSAGKIRNFFFLRNLASDLLQKRQKQFDFSQKLQLARRIYTGQCEIDPAALKTIECYGDLSDLFPLHELKRKITNTRLKQKIQNLLMTTYAYEPRYVQGTS